jgi:ELWxxDGT repeat protein
MQQSRDCRCRRRRHRHRCLLFDRAHIDVLEPRRLLSGGATSATTINDLFAPGDNLVSNAVQFGSTGFFFQRDGSTTTARLWQTDGTGAGTIQTDVTFQVTGIAADPKPLLALDDGLLLLASDAEMGNELWLTDGTAAGTQVVSNFAAAAAAPANFLAVSGDLAVFTLSDASSGAELWRTDGTLAGTQRVKDINPGSASSSPALLTAMGGRVYFRADDGVHGTELWTSDGTDAGTTMVADIFPGSGTSAIAALSADAASGRLFFSARGATGGNEPWISDGTAEGTHLIKEINPTGPSSPTTFTSFAGKVYFTAVSAPGRALWVTDGTTDGTQFIKDVDIENFDQPHPAMVTATDRLFIQGPVTAGIWASDGTAAGTVQVADDTGFPVHDLRALGARAVFVSARSFQMGEEIWVSDGTPAGTGVLRDVAAGPATSLPTQLSVINVNGGAALYFAATDRVGGAGAWISNGTADATTRLPTTPAAAVPVTSITRIVSSGDRAYVFGRYTSPYLKFGVDGLWVTNGRAGGTELLHGDASSGVARTGADGRLYFGSEQRLFVTDGTAQGTHLIPIATSMPNSTEGGEFSTAVVGNTFYYLQNYQEWELWTSDGSAGGTKRVRFLGSNPGFFQTVGQRVVFFMSSSSTGEEPWVTDGTDAGTHLLKDVRSGSLGSVSSNLFGDRPRFFTVGNRGYFFADDGVNHNALWTTDGTTEGTHFVTNVLAGAARPESRVAWATDGQTIYFTYLQAPSSPYAVYRTDGTAAGTQLIRGDFNNLPMLFVSNGKLLIFTSLGGAGLTPSSIYASDGTSSGDLQLVHSFVADSDSYPSDVAVASDGIYFSAGTSAEGNELWFTDGTPAGTHLVRDIFPGTLSSHPDKVTAVAQSVFFTTDDKKLWLAPPPAQAGPDSAGVRSGVDAEYAFSGPADHQTLTVSTGSVTLTDDAAARYPSLSIVVEDGATVMLVTTQHLAGLEVMGSVKVTGDEHVIVTDELVMGPNARLDLGANDMIINYAGASPIGSWDGSAYSGILGMIQTGRTENGTWDGAGIITSMPQATAGLTGIGVGEASGLFGLSDSETAPWNGQTIDATAVILKYTYAGDANLDGVIDGGDYGIIDNFVQVPSAFGYFNGDFNYDGVIDGGDYGVIDNNIQAQGTPL